MASRAAFAQGKKLSSAKDSSVHTRAGLCSYDCSRIRAPTPPEKTPARCEIAVRTSQTLFLGAWAVNSQLDSILATNYSSQYSLLGMGCCRCGASKGEVNRDKRRYGWPTYTRRLTIISQRKGPIGIHWESL